MNSKMVWLVAWHEYSTNVRRPGFIFATLLFPALGLIGLIVATFFSGQAGNFFKTQFTPDTTQKIGVVDASGLYTPIAPRYAERFVAYATEEEAQAAVNAGKLTGFIVVPKDYVSSGAITIYSKDTNLNSAIALDSATINPFLVNGLLADKVDTTTLARVNKPSTTTRISLEAKNGNSADSTRNNVAFVGGLLGSYAITILLFVSIFTSANYLLRSISEEKENRVIEILISSLSPIELLAGKVIGLGSLGLTQVAVWIASSVVLSGGLAGLALGAVFALNPVTIALGFVYFILGYLLFAILMATAGALGTSMRESQQIAGIFSFAAAIPWMLNGFLFINPNILLARLLSYFPLTAPTMMMLRLAIGQTPPEDIVISIVVLLISVPIFLWGGTKVFRVSLLMYGKRLSLKEIWGVLRSA